MNPRGFPIGFVTRGEAQCEDDGRE